MATPTTPPNPASPSRRSGSRLARSPPPERPRSRMLSFGSRKSSGSGSMSYSKGDMMESPKEKADRRMTTKADPRLALNEAQPAAQALAETTLHPIRSIEHRDTSGNPIADPDRSNPTRSRMERPLDTIRSFEAAIETTYNKRQSQIGRPEFQLGPQGMSSIPGTPETQSRRSSWMMPNTGHPPPHLRGRGEPGGGYGRPRPHPRLPQPRPTGGPGPMRRSLAGPSRNHSDPTLYGGNASAFPPSAGGYEGGPAPGGAPGALAAYDAATTGSGSGSASQGEPWASSTGPSSENSSVNAAAAPAAAAAKPPPPPPHHHHQQPPRRAFGPGAPAPPPQQQQQQQQQQPDLADVYGMSNFGAGPQPSMGLGPGPAAASASGGPPPPPPAHSQFSRGGAAARPAAPGAMGPPPRPPPKGQDKEKRKSWLKRAFGK